MMENKTVRRLNLDGLIAQFGTIAALAKATGTVANYLSQVRNGHRDMGDDIARRLEDALNKKTGWLDSLQFSSADDVMIQTEALQILASLTDADREAWIKHGRLLVENRPDSGVHNPFPDAKKPKKTPGGNQ